MCGKQTLWSVEIKTIFKTTEDILNRKRYMVWREYLLAQYRSRAQRYGPLRAQEIQAVWNGFGSCVLGFDQLPAFVKL